MSNYNYDDAVMAANAAQTVKTESESGIIDRRYYRGIPAIFKAVEVVCSLIAYILVELSPSCGVFPLTFGFFKFISMTAFVVTLILWVLLLLKVPQRILRCNCVNWPFFEVSLYGGIVVFYFFGDLFLALHGKCRAGFQAGAAFGFFALFAYIGDGAYAFRLWWNARKAGGLVPSSPSQVEGPGTGGSKY